MTETNGIAAERLRSFVERIERLEEARSEIGADIREVHAEAKAGGFDVKTLRMIVILRALDAADRDEQAALLELYKAALGMS